MEEVELGLYKPDSITKNQVQYLHNSVVAVQSASEERAGEQDREVLYCFRFGHRRLAYIHVEPEPVEGPL
jgi:hypothetical protein